MKIEVYDGQNYELVELEVCIKENYFCDVLIAKALANGNSEYLNMYYKIKRDIFSEYNWALDKRCGSEINRSPKVEKSYLSEDEVKTIISPIFVLWDYKLTAKQFEIWYKNLKKFSKKKLRKQVDIVCTHNVFKPKLGDFYK